MSMKCLRAPYSKKELCQANRLELASLVSFAFLRLLAWVRKQTSAPTSSRTVFAKVAKTEIEKLRREVRRRKAPSLQALSYIPHQICKTYACLSCS